MPLTNGQVFWIFGLSGAGKSTMAAALAAELRNEHLPMLMLDGYALRTCLCRGLGFSDQDRS
jgi:adenylylsulfate kinase-like enzyme